MRELAGAAGSLHQQAAELSRRIDLHDAQRLKLERSLAEVEDAAAGEYRRLKMRQLQQAIRRPAASLNLWPLGLLLVGGVLAGSVAFIFGTMAGDAYVSQRGGAEGGFLQDLGRLSDR